MAIPFDARALLCTAAVMTALGAATQVPLPQWASGPGSGMAGGRLLPLGGAAGERDERLDMIGEVLRHEAQRPERQNVCLRSPSRGGPFDGRRALLEELQQRSRTAPGDDRAARIDMLRNPRTRWRSPESGEPLHELIAQALSSAETILSNEPGPLEPTELALDPGAVPEALRSNDPACAPLIFTRPAVTGPVAFVATRYECSGECGEERLYAVVRRREGWSLLAQAGDAL